MQIQTLQHHFRPEEKNRSERTRMRLLNAASRIFAEKGFQKSTIAEICQHANVNVASVNYHFGDKETIYIEAWRYAFRRESAQFSFDDGLSRSPSPEERLEGWIRLLIHRIADRQSYSFAILHREMASPTHALSKFLALEIQPLRKQLIRVLEECLGLAIDQRQLEYHYASIMGLCLQFIWLRQVDDANRQFSSWVELGDADSFADHVIRFALAGIQASRKQRPN